MTVSQSQHMLQLDGTVSLTNVILDYAAASVRKDEISVCYRSIKTT